LQHSKDIDAIKAASVKKVLGLLEDLAENKQDQYQAFWDEFGRVLKEGPGEDFTNKEKIAGLLRFASTNLDSEAQVVGFKDYIGRMKEGQEAIYYITADSFARASIALIWKSSVRKVSKFYCFQIVWMSGCWVA
jgi:molecular chaperone HtpG